MKIVQLDSQVAWRGGEQQVLYLVQALRHHGYDNVTVCPPTSALYERAGEAGLSAQALRMRHELDLVAAWRLGRYLRRHRVDILHMHDPHAHTIGLLACTLAPQVHKVVSRRVDFAPRRNRLSRWKYAASGTYYLAVSDAVRTAAYRSTGSGRSIVASIRSAVSTCRKCPPYFPAARVSLARWATWRVTRGIAICSRQPSSYWPQSRRWGW
jgi:hypothetical protein